MSEVLVTKGEIEEDTDPTFMRLLVDADGVALVQSDVVASGITLNVYDLSSDTPDVAVTTLSSLDPTVLMFNTLQTTGWSQGSDGYSFRHRVPVSGLGIVGGRTYAFEYRFQLAASQGSGVAWALFEVSVRPIRSN